MVLPDIAFIDIVGDDRIQTILDAPDSFNLRAIRAETLLDWIPDLGTYSAPCRCRMQNGVFRTPGLATSGLPAELRHRFWMEEDAQRVVGPKYVGLLVYDDESDAYTFELSSGADPIGALCPWRHDNRRHLLVTAEPAFIRSGHIPFVVRALGRGPCYLESVVFMSERPQPTSFAPEIKRLSTRLPGGAEGRLIGEVHFVTQEAAQALVEASSEDDGESVISRSAGWERLHAVTLTGLRPSIRYQVRVTATERGGETTTSRILLDTTPAERLTTGPTTVPVEIVRTGQAVRVGLPLTFGVPLAAGQLLTPGSAVLSCQGERVAAQTRVHSRWPDGTARWVLVDVPVPSALAAASSVAAEVELNPPDAQPAAGLTWQADGRAITVVGQSLRVTVAVDGPLPARIERRTVDGGWLTLRGASGPCLSGSLGNGVTFANGRPVALTLEEAGTERAVIRYELPLVDSRGIEHFRTTVRLHVYARQPFVRLVQRTVVTSPVLGPAFGANGLAHLTPELEHVRAATDGADGEMASLLRVRELEMRLPGEIMASDASAGDAADWRLAHEHDRAYQLTQHGETREVAGRRAGLFTGSGQALCIKHFWQTYPKGVRRSADGVTLEVLPPLSGQPLPEYDELWHKLYFWYQPAGMLYRLKAGMALTTDLVFGYPAHVDEAAEWQEWLEHPPAVRPDLDHLNRTGALLEIGSKEGSPVPHYEALMAGHAQVWMDLVDRRHEYGFINFGDTYSDYEWFWSNNEYDATFIQYLEFLRGGDPRWYLLALRTVRHLADIDSCNFSRDQQQVGAQYIHIPGHTGGYLPAFFRSKMAGSAFKPSHSWVEGEILHYLLTGDETVRELLQKSIERYGEELRYYDFTNARECGWHLVHLCGLDRLGDDPRPLNAASIIVDTVLARQEPGGGWEHPLTEAHCHCEPPRCHGEAGFMVGVLLTGLRRYYEMTGDVRVAEAIVGGARWLARSTFLPDVGQFRYTSCPTRSKPGFPSGQLVEGLAMAQALTPAPEVAAALKVALVDLGKDLDFHTGTTRYGRDLSPEARQVPLMLALLR